MSYTNGLDKPSDYFNTILNTGDNTSPKSISGFGFQPDWVWTKCRTAAYDHSISDSVRGANKTIRSNNTSAEVSDDIYGNLTAFNSDGFTATAGSNSINYYNQSGQTYVNWGWLAGGSASSNSNGSITSTVSANTTAGFSIVSYTGTGSSATVGHGLGVTPKMIIIKDRDTGTHSWVVGHDSLAWTSYLLLNSADAKGTATTIWNDTAPTSSVFTLGTNVGMNGSGSSQIAYCFAEKKGYSKFSSYVGNGSSDGSFIYTGFKPAFVIIKNTTGDHWYMHDNKRNPSNLVDKIVLSNLNFAESTSSASVVDYLSNGFKIRGTDGSHNASGGSYSIMAFGQSIVGSNNIPATAR